MNSGTPVVKASGLLWDLGLLEPQLWSFCGLLDQRSTPAADLQPKSTWPFGAMCYGLDIKCPLQAHGSEHLFPAILLFGNMRPRRWKQVSWVFGGSSLFSLLPAHSNVAKTFLLASYHTLPTTAAALPCFLYHDGPRETVSSSKAFSQQLKKICLFLFLWGPDICLCTICMPGVYRGQKGIESPGTGVTGGSGNSPSLFWKNSKCF